MHEPRERFGRTAGRFYERGMARTPTGRKQRIRARDTRYVHKPRPTGRKPRLTVQFNRLHPFQWLGMTLCLGALVILFAGIGRHDGRHLPPVSLLIMWGCMFSVLGQQAAAKKRREQR